MEVEFGVQDEEKRGVDEEVKKVMCIWLADIVIVDMSMLCIDEEEVAIGIELVAMEAMFILLMSMVREVSARLEVGREIVSCCYRCIRGSTCFERSAACSKSLLRRKTTSA